jgi:ribA/ribD-fused uncharacterized protein
MTYVYFHKPNDANGFLSQWYPCKITEGNIVFSSAEQYMMYHKAKLFGDLQSAMLIKQENNPAKIKVLGRQVCSRRLVWLCRSVLRRARRL